jgi:hypothetical protein
MRFPLPVLVTALLFGLSLSAHADPLTTIYINAIASDGGLVTGTLVLDETTGQWVSSDILETSYGRTDTFTGAPYFSVNDIDSLAGFFGTISGDYLYIAVDDASLAGYIGGGLCTTAAPCGNGSDSGLQLGGINDTNFKSGDLSLTPNATLTPEPSSLILLGTGALGILGVGRRKLLSANRA